MAVRTVSANRALHDQIAAQLDQAGVPNDVTARLLPALASADPAVSRAAFEWAYRNATIGLDLSDEGRAGAAQLARQAEGFMKTLPRQSLADDVETERYDPSEKAMLQEADRRDILAKRAPLSKLSAVTGKQYEPEPLAIRSTAPRAFTTSEVDQRLEVGDENVIDALVRDAGAWGAAG